MTLEAYIKLLEHPNSIDGNQLEALDQVIKNYPYLQSARALQLKALKDASSNQYNTQLKATAAYTSERAVLFDYITSKEFLNHKISQIITQHSESVKNILVEVEDLSEKISAQIAHQIKEERKKAEAILNPHLFERKNPEPTSINLNTDAPLEFTKDETHSFMEWLKLTHFKPIEREEVNEGQKKEQPNISRKFELIDRFIEEQQKSPDRIRTAIQPSKNENEDLAAPYTKPSEDLMTETLAKVYLQQKNYEKAIQAYKILILKNPEKSGFFADQIRAIENLINKQ